MSRHRGKTDPRLEGPLPVVSFDRLDHAASDLFQGLRIDPPVRADTDAGYALDRPQIPEEIRLANPTATCASEPHSERCGSVSTGQYLELR